MCACACVCVCVSLCSLGMLSFPCTLSLGLGLSLSPPLPLQAQVEAPELLQEARVGEDVPVRFDCGHGLPEGQALGDHQEGEHQRGGAAYSHQAVD